MTPRCSFLLAVLWALNFCPSAALQAETHQNAVAVAATGQEPIDFKRAHELFDKQQQGGQLTAEEQAYIARAIAQQKSQKGQKAGKSDAPRSTTPVSDSKVVASLVPLDELTGTYKGEDGGLYGGNCNAAPQIHLTAYLKESAKIQPLDADGKPSARGKIVLLSIGMSNTTMEYSRFVEIANAYPEKSAQVVLVDGAQGGRVGAAWAMDGGGLLPAAETERLTKLLDKMGHPMKPDSMRIWSTVEARLKANGVTPQQVQVIWVKHAEGHPARLGEFPEHARILEADIVDTLNIAKQKYPNLRVAYLSSRIFAGYATTDLNPEPYAYEGAFALRWVIQDQIKGEPRLNYDPTRGAVNSPIVMWGPYLWANGTKPRKSDGLVWNPEDFVVNDHTHPAYPARQKVASLLLQFFKTDPGSKKWFLKSNG